MSLEEKLSKLMELSKIPYPNNEEFAEKERLKEEIKLIYGESHIFKEQKKSLLDIIIQKLKKKPITYEQIEKLKNEKTVAYLKRDIAKAKYEARNPGGKKKESKTDLKLFSSPKEMKSSRDLRDMVGHNDSKKYKGLIP